MLVINWRVWEYCQLSVLHVCGSSFYFTLSALANYHCNNNNGNLHSKHYLKKHRHLWMSSLMRSALFALRCMWHGLVRLFAASLVPSRHMGAHWFLLFHYNDADNVLASRSTVAKHSIVSLFKYKKSTLGDLLMFAGFRELDHKN